jgi:nicotinamide phosphoribosyltransferase
MGNLSDISLDFVDQDDLHFIRDVPILLRSDSYKTSHHLMLPQGCTLMYGNWTPRSFKWAPKGTTHMIPFGHQMMLKWLHTEFDKFFADDTAVDYCKDFISKHLNCDYNVDHFARLWNLQYLPMCFKSLPEGVRVPAKVPVMTFYNTHKDHAWLSLYLETILSNDLWKPATSATIIDQFKKNTIVAVSETDPDNMWLADYMLHDFSARGMGSHATTELSGAGFLVMANGTDSLSALQAVRNYYHGDMVGNSVFASEHSVSSACMGVMSEEDMVSYWMDQYPEGILSCVMDTMDLTFAVMPKEGGIFYNLKDKVLARDGKVVIRPDSSPRTPADIVCGHDEELSERELEAHYPEFYLKGLVQCLWEIFGGTVNSQGYKVLDPHCGAIYGEAINLEMQEEIYKRLKEKGFAATNIVMGIGSYTLNMNSRDTLGFAAKGTYCEINGEEIDIYKDPVTSSGVKKSAKGKMRVDIVDGEYTMTDQVNWEEEAEGELREIYRDGKILVDETFEQIRERARN